jgi:hypothetical protein
MKCKNHADIDAVARCTGCQEAFCENCLVEMNGKKYCSDCKIMVVCEKPKIEFEFETPKIPCIESRYALIFVLISFLIPSIASIHGIIFMPVIGIFLGFITILISLDAKKRIKEDINLSGEVMARVILFLGVLIFIIWSIRFIATLNPYGGSDGLFNVWRNYKPDF